MNNKTKQEVILVTSLTWQAHFLAINKTEQSFDYTSRWNGAWKGAWPSICPNINSHQAACCELILIAMYFRYYLPLNIHVHLGMIGWNWSSGFRECFKCHQYIFAISILKERGPLFEQSWIPFHPRMQCAKFFLFGKSKQKVKIG